MDEDTVYSAGSYGYPFWDAPALPVLSRPSTNEFHVSPDVGLIKHLREAWKQELLVDFTIHVGHEQFKVHKIVMACTSDYFKAMLTGGMVESQTDTVRLEGLDPLAVSNIIEYIYTNRIMGERASPEDLLACAMYLQIPTAIEASTKMLQKKLDNENCLDILTAFDAYSLKGPIKETQEYIATNMEEILKVHDLDRLTYERLLILVKLWMDGELDLFLIIKDWLDVDYENRKQHLDSLMSHVRFSLLTPAELEAVKKMKMYSEGSWQDNVQQALDYHSQPVHKKMMRPTSVRSKLQPVCFNEEAQHTLEENGRWKEIDFEEIPDFEHGITAVLEFNNFLILFEKDCGRIDPEDMMHVFDSSTLTWSTLPNMNVHRFNFTLVHDGKYLYALGGNPMIEDDYNDMSEAIDTIERYDPETNTWTVMSARLPGPLCQHSACVCSGDFFSIYVAGGWDRITLESDCSSALNCFNPYEEEATWHSKAPMLINSPADVMREMAFDGKDPVIIIMCDDLLIQYYDLKTDQWSKWDAWACIDIDWQWHHNGTVLADPAENTLYVLNIEENFPNRLKEPEQGACGKWPLSKEDDAIFGCPVEKFPIKTVDLSYSCEAYAYVASMLAIPRPSKRALPNLAQSESKLTNLTSSVPKVAVKRYNLRNSKA